MEKNKEVIESVLVLADKILAQKENFVKGYGPAVNNYGAMCEPSKDAVAFSLYGALNYAFHRKKKPTFITGKDKQGNDIEVTALAVIFSLYDDVLKQINYNGVMCLFEFQRSSNTSFKKIKDSIKKVRQDLNNKLDIPPEWVLK